MRPTVCVPSRPTMRSCVHGLQRGQFPISPSLHRILPVSPFRTVTSQEGVGEQIVA
jgi:hypothetical protein